MELETPPAGEPDPVGLFVTAALGAALSLLVTGFIFGTNNNLFDLPIIGRLYDAPQFRDDTFIQSLRFFAAGPFLVLQGADRVIAPAHLFLLLAYLSRLLSFLGFLACARLLGVTGWYRRALFATLLAFTSLMQGYSFAGDDGLFINYFTHSEIANGLTLLAFYYAARGRLIEAFAMNGFVFFTNAFVAVWNAGPFAAIIILLLLRRRLTLRQLLIRGALGLVIFLVLASPVLFNVLHNPDFGRKTPFSYRAFLAEYWPFHFLWSWNPLRHKIALGAVVVTGLLAFFIHSSRDLARRADPFQAALCGGLAIYGLGIALPAVTDSAALLNLHLLRSSGNLHLLATLASVALATRWLTEAEPAERRLWGPLLVLVSCGPRPALLLTPLVLAAFLGSRHLRLPDWLLRGRPSPQLLLVLVLAVLWPITIWHNARANAVTQGHINQWRSVGAWARANTPIDAVFLIPTSNLRDGWLHPGAPHDPHSASEGTEIFDYASQRRVWVDFKRGAAVLWSPSYYPLWHSRINEVLALTTLDQKLAYAASHHIGYVVDSCFGGGTHPILFHTRDICVFAAPSSS
jgi:hypothetical protein